MTYDFTGWTDERLLHRHQDIQEQLTAIEVELAARGIRWWRMPRKKKGVVR